MQYNKKAEPWYEGGPFEINFIEGSAPDECRILRCPGGILGDGALALADLAYEGEPETFTIPFKKPKDGQLSVDQQSYNAVHGALRCLGERANSLLKTTCKALRRYRGCPWRIWDIVAAALVLLHHEHGRTT